MAIKLYGFWLGYPRMVAAVLKKKNVPFEFVELDLENGAQRTPAYLEKHPFGQVPVLDDDGYILYESRAICRYIARKYADQGTPLLPPPGDVKAEGLFEQAASVEAFRFAGPAYAAADHVFYQQLRGLPEEHEQFEEKLKVLEQNLEVYDKILSKQRWLAGENITLVDMFHLYLGWALETGSRSDIMTRKPNVARWWNELKSRPSWVEVQDGRYDNDLHRWVSISAKGL